MATTSNRTDVSVVVILLGNGDATYLQNNVNIFNASATCITLPIYMQMSHVHCCSNVHYY